MTKWISLGLLIISILLLTILLWNNKKDNSELQTLKTNYEQSIRMHRENNIKLQLKYDSLIIAKNTELKIIQEETEKEVTNRITNNFKNINKPLDIKNDQVILDIDQQREVNKLFEIEKIQAKEIEILVEQNINKDSIIIDQDILIKYQDQIIESKSKNSLKEKAVSLGIGIIIGFLISTL